MLKIPIGLSRLGLFGFGEVLLVFIVISVGLTADFCSSYFTGAHLLSIYYVQGILPR